MRRNIGWIAVVSLIGALAGCGGEVVDSGTISEPTIERTTTTTTQSEGLPMDSSAITTEPVTDGAEGSSPTTTAGPPTAAERSDPTRPTAVALTEPIGESLNQADVDGLVWIREEEKLARDVYLALSETWDLPIFSNIAASEQTHTDAVGDLLELYGISDPMADDAPGVFQDPTIQSLYDDFVQQGSRSLVEALTVGVAIEDLDIVDLRLRESGVAAIDEVYANLEKGSRNHLRAFVSNLERQGGDYSPSHLALEEYEAIIDSPPERGRAGG